MQDNKTVCVLYVPVWLIPVPVYTRTVRTCTVIVLVLYCTVVNTNVFRKVIGKLTTVCEFFIMECLQYSTVTFSN